MSRAPAGPIAAVCLAHDNDPGRLLDIVRDVQEQLGCVDDAVIDEIASQISVPRVEVAGVVSFYAFLSTEPEGQVTIRLCNDLIDELKGSAEIAESLEQELGIRFGESTPDGKFALDYASCIGMSDQAPAALVNDIVVPSLGPGTAVRGVRILKDLDEIDDLHRILIRSYGDGNNSHDLVRAAVENNLRRPGEVIFGESEPGAGLSKAMAMSPAEVIREVKTARLRGRGGAGFPTGMKWEFTRASGGPRRQFRALGEASAATPLERYLICNADEGEPGTFKDRVILTERPHLLFEGMTIAGYAIGAAHGIVYLRAEYAYLRQFLEHILEERRDMGLLGKDIADQEGFDFDIRIQMGAGAYICGEETALINSCEGTRGDPKNRPPFPAQEGYLGKPTSVNNVETLCCVARILENGSGWFSSFGSKGSTGTKLLSVSGDCTRPGVYEVPFGIRLRDVFELCGADRPFAAQVGGPSGEMVGEKDFDRAICYDDLATGGALMVFREGRSPVEIAAKFLEFFIHESCGYCTPCRVGNVLLKERLDEILAGRGEPADFDYLEELAMSVKTASRCGLGQTSPNPVLTTLANFRSSYEQLVSEPKEGSLPRFDIHEALTDAQSLTGRKSVHFTMDGEQ